MYFWPSIGTSNGRIDGPHLVPKVPLLTTENWVVVSKIVYLHPEPWGRFPFGLIFFRWVGSTTKSQKLRAVFFSKMPSL